MHFFTIAAFVASLSLALPEYKGQLANLHNDTLEARNYPCPGTACGHLGCFPKAWKCCPGGSAGSLDRERVCPPDTTCDARGWAQGSGVDMWFCCRHRPDGSLKCPPDPDWDPAFDETTYDDEDIARDKYWKEHTEAGQPH